MKHGLSYPTGWGICGDGAAHNGAMETDLAAIKVAFAVMSNTELDALIQATYKVEEIAPRVDGVDSAIS